MSLVCDPPTPAASALPADQLVKRIIELGQHLGTLHHQLVHALAQYDHSGLWHLSGHPTCAAWVADTLAVALSTAREWLRVGHALATLPHIDAAFQRGRLSYRQVRTLTRIAADHPDREAELLQLAERTTPRDLAVALAAWTTRHEDADDTDRRHRRDTSLSARIEPDGMGVITLRLPPAELGAVMAAIDATVMTTKNDPNASMDASDPATSARPSLAQQRAAALLNLLTTGGTTVSTEVIVHVRADGCALHDGTPIGDHAVARLLPGAFIRAMIHDAESHPINVSGRHRHPTDRQKLVIDERQPTCDCGATAFLVYHHEPPYEQSGRTVVDEFQRKCGRCHRLRHGRG